MLLVTNESIKEDTKMKYEVIEKHKEVNINTTEYEFCKEPFIFNDSIMVKKLLNDFKKSKKRKIDHKKFLRSISGYLILGINQYFWKKEDELLNEIFSELTFWNKNNLLKWCIYDYIREEKHFYSFLNGEVRELYCVHYNDFLSFLKEKIENGV